MPRHRIRIALLGAGAMARVHAAAYATLPDVELIDVPARDDARVCAVLEDRAVDAVDICLPSAVHARFAIRALEHGKHVFCETPMALRLDEARSMRDAARKAGRLLQVGLLMRSVAGYRHMKVLTDAGTHGRLLSLSTWRLGSYLRPDAPDHKPHYGDPTTELMTFDLDFANWLMGTPARISAAGTGEVTALLDYADGRHATISATGLMPKGMPFAAGFRSRPAEGPWHAARQGVRRPARRHARHPRPRSGHRVRRHDPAPGAGLSARRTWSDRVKASIARSASSNRGSARPAMQSMKRRNSIS
jgi:predicted dehydrogenase